MGQGSSRTAIEVCNHRWTIKNFVFCGERLESDVFTIGNLKWRMELHPNGPAVQGDVWLSLYIRLVESDRAAVRATFKFGVYNWGRGEVYPKNIRCQSLEPGQRCGFEQFIRRSDAISELEGADLKIRCGVSFLNHSPTDDQVRVPESSLTNDVAQLFNSDALTDCTLVAEGKEFAVHKALLAVRSPVFSVMFKHQMLETETNRVPIDDLRPDVVYQMLSFIYTGNAPELNSMADELLVAADKYQLERLRAMCEKALTADLTPQNACQTLILADRHSTNQLKTRALGFIKMQVEAVTKTEGWATLMSNYPQLVTELIRTKTNVN